MYPICPPPEFHPHEPEKNFKLECVIICDKYADFLACTLPHNRHFFNYCVVVTSPEDVATQKLCEFWEVHCVVTDALKSSEGLFCKGAAINKGLEVLKMDGWVLHLDADIWLPPLTRQLLQHAALDKSMLYGVDRFNVRGWLNWQRFLSRPALQQENGSWTHLSNHPFPMGTRFYQKHMGGYIPPGFFQLWNPTTSEIYRYPEGRTWAGNEDMIFASNWSRAKRSFFPELVGYHLESIDADFGANWKGRTTAYFGPAEEEKKDVQ